MRVRMLVSISGTRDGDAWPPVGGELDVSDVEGASLVSGGLAVGVAVEVKPEKRPAVKRAEKRA